MYAAYIRHFWSLSVQGKPGVIQFICLSDYAERQTPGLHVLNI